MRSGAFPSKTPMERLQKHTHLSEHGVRYGAEVDRSFISQVVEDIESSDGLRSLLLVSEYQINPLMQLTGHKLTLQSLHRR